MAKEVKAPRKDCKERKVTEDYNCHMDCEKYLAFQAYRTEIREDRAKKYAVEPKRRRYF